MNAAAAEINPGLDDAEQATREIFDDPDAGGAAHAAEGEGGLRLALMGGDRLASEGGVIEVCKLARIDGLLDRQGAGLAQTLKGDEGADASAAAESLTIMTDGMGEDGSVAMGTLWGCDGSAGRLHGGVILEQGHCILL
jgi:hypothetical protein